MDYELMWSYSPFWLLCLFWLVAVGLQAGAVITLWFFFQRKESDLLDFRYIKWNDLSFFAMEKLTSFCLSLDISMNPIIDQIAICRCSGKLFFSKEGRLFIKKTNCGNLMAWNQLSHQQKQPFFALFLRWEKAVGSIAADGEELYIDPAKKQLLSWKIVPGTHLKALVILSQHRDQPVMA